MATINEWLTEETLQEYWRPNLRASHIEFIAHGGLDESGIEKKFQVPEVLNNEERNKLLSGIATEHFAIESELSTIVIYFREDGNEFLFLEINPQAIPTGRIEPFYFAPSTAFPWPIYIADVTPDEWMKITRGIITLPPGWPSWPMKPVLIVERPHGSYHEPTTRAGLCGS